LLDTFGPQIEDIAIAIFRRRNYSSIVARDVNRCDGIATCRQLDLIADLKAFAYLSNSDNAIITASHETRVIPAQATHVERRMLF
jgi:hypothetical protein